MKLEEYQKLDAIGMAELISQKEVTPTELMNCAIEMVERTEMSINAVSYYDVAMGKEKAAKPSKGIFQGVPFLVKELLNYPGLRSAMGSRLLKQNFTQEGSDFTNRINEAGFKTFGNTSSSEFGMIGSTETILNGITKNPWNKLHSAGGSSGGSAAAVASGIVPMAHASDGGGSIRYPASVNGLFGFKPSKGRCVYAMDQSYVFADIQSEHCITKTVRDSAAFLSVTEQKKKGAPFSPIGFCNENENRPLRIGVYNKTLMGKDPDGEVQEVLNYSVKLCEDLGHTLISVDLPKLGGGGKEFSDSFFIIGGYAIDQIVQQMEPFLNRKIDENDLEPFTLELIRWFQKMKPEAYEKALADLYVAGEDMLQFAKQFDVLLSPTIAKVPQKLEFLSPELDLELLIKRTEEYVGYTPIHNSPGCGMCAMSVPLYSDKSGMPVGTHFAALPGKEETLFNLAYQLEAAAPWIDRLPLYPI